MHRAGVPGPEPGDLLVDAVDVALGQQLTNTPHVPVQGELLVTDFVGDLPELRSRRQSLGRRLNAPQRVHAGVEREAESDPVPEAAGHRDRLVAEGE